MRKLNYSVFPLMIGALAVGSACSKEEPTKAASATASASAAPASAPAVAGEALPAAQAHAHLTSSCQVVVRVGITELLANEAVKKHLVPAYEKGIKKEATGKKGKSVKATLDKMGVDPLKDITELAVCVSNLGEGKKPDFAVVVAGKLRADSVVPAVLELDEKKESKEVEVGGVKALSVEKDNVFLGQARDGSIVFAQGKEAFEAALGTSDAATKTFKLPTQGSFGAVVPGDTFKQFKEQAAKSPFGSYMDKVERFQTTTDISAGTSEMRVEVTDEKLAEKLTKELTEMLAELKTRPPRGPMAMVLGIIGDAKIAQDGKAVVVTSTMKQEQLEGLLEQLAEGLSKEL